MNVKGVYWLVQQPGRKLEVYKQRPSNIDQLLAIGCKIHRLQTVGTFTSATPKEKIDGRGRGKRKRGGERRGSSMSSPISTTATAAGF